MSSNMRSTLYNSEWHAIAWLARLMYNVQCTSLYRAMERCTLYKQKTIYVGFSNTKKKKFIQYKLRKKIKRRNSDFKRYKDNN